MKRISSRPSAQLGTTFIAVVQPFRTTWSGTSCRTKLRAHPCMIFSYMLWQNCERWDTRQNGGCTLVRDIRVALTPLKIGVMNYWTIATARSTEMCWEVPLEKSRKRAAQGHLPTALPSKESREDGQRIPASGWRRTPLSWTTIWRYCKSFSTCRAASYCTLP